MNSITNPFYCLSIISPADADYINQDIDIWISYSGTQQANL